MGQAGVGQSRVRAEWWGLGGAGASWIGVDWEEGWGSMWWVGGGGSVPLTWGSVHGDSLLNKLSDSSL